MKSKKIQPHNKVAQVLLSGNMTSVSDIVESFKLDDKMNKVMYRLSTYIYDIRKYEQGIIKVEKNGRKVTGYKLLNTHEFNSDGIWVGEQKKNVPEVPAEVVAEVVPEVSEQSEQELVEV
jgi:hypothetical protein